MAQIEILPVEGFWRFTAFCRLPRQIYAGMEGFSPPPDLQRWTLFSHRLNPHYRLVEEVKFLARREGRYVGRISAHVYKDGAAPNGASAAQFGALDAIDNIEVVRALTDAAEDWLRAKGATRINGPFSPSINGESGMLVDGFEATPMFTTTWHPPYLSKHLDALGYEKARDLISYTITVSPDELAKPARISNRAEWKNRLNIRPLDFKRLKKGETQLMTDLFNDGWRENWGFVPFTKAEFDDIADSLGFVTPPEYTLVVELDGEPKSFAVALPNLFEITHDLGGRLFPFGPLYLLLRSRLHKYTGAKLILLGTRNELQNSATGGAILLAMIEEMRRRGAATHLKEIEAGWVLENNMAMRKPIEMFGGKAYKVHRIYEKRLALADNAASDDAASVHARGAVNQQQDAMA